MSEKFFQIVDKMILLVEQINEHQVSENKNEIVNPFILSVAKNVVANLNDETREVIMDKFRGRSQRFLEDIKNRDVSKIREITKSAIPEMPESVRNGIVTKIENGDLCEEHIQFFFTGLDQLVASC